MKKTEPKRPHPCEKGEARPRNAEDTRERLLRAGKRLFSEAAYEHVQTREIAALANVDAALVNRYFGSKEGLFSEVVASLALQTPFASYEAMKETFIRIFTEMLRGEAGRDGSSIRLILASAQSPSVSHIVSAFFQKQAARLEAVLPEGSRNTRANLLLAYVLGTLTVFQVLRASGAPQPDVDLIIDRFKALLDEVGGEEAAPAPTKKAPRCSGRKQ